MKKLNFKNKLLIFLLIITIVLLVINSSIKKDNLNFLDRFFKDTTYVISSVVSSPIKLVKNVIHTHNEKDDIYNKYKKLQEEYEKTQFDKIRIEELEKTNRALKDVLGIKHDLQGYTYLNSTVVSRDVGYWYDTITIDKGSRSGIDINMAVITNKGLIGKVVKTSSLTSTVKLLASDNLNMKVSVKIKVGDNYFYGLLTGYDREKKCYIIEGISNNIEVPINSVVTTTGMSDIFPSGILVGTVSEIGTDNFELSKIIYVKTKVNYDDLEYVTVLKRNYDS